MLQSFGSKQESTWTLQVIKADGTKQAPITVKNEVKKCYAPKFVMNLLTRMYIWLERKANDG